MNDLVSNQFVRHRFSGVLQIARYNWPGYFSSGAAVLVMGAWLRMDPGGHGELRAATWIAVLLAGWWCAASLLASHWVYDRSELYRWTWIPSALPAKPKHWLNLHAGLDESSATLRELFPGSSGRTCDFFDASEMTEPSIRRARAEQAALTAVRVDHRHLPFADGSFDTVFVFFAAHELRHASSRERFFRELRRVLGPSGTVLLVEHVRDLANFAAFGPGFLHFFGDAEWRRLAGLAGLELANEVRMTPFVKVFQLRRPL